MKLNILQLYLNGLMIFTYFLNYQHWHMIESFILNVVKSITWDLHFALTIIFSNGYNFFWKVSDLYFNALGIRSKC
jgi:hypothetical protein